MKYRPDFREHEAVILGAEIEPFNGVADAGAVNPLKGFESGFTYCLIQSIPPCLYLIFIYFKFRLFYVFIKIPKLANCPISQEQNISWHGQEHTRNLKQGEGYSAHPESVKNQ
jgi:hypothetical protein